MNCMKCHVMTTGFNKFDQTITRLTKFVIGFHLNELDQVPLIISIIIGSINFWLLALLSKAY